MPDRSSFTLDTAADSTGTVVTLGGDLDLTNAPALARALAGLRQTPLHRLVLHMAGVACLDVTAARVIATAAQAWPGPVVIRDPSPIVRRLLEVSGLAAGLRLEQTTPGSLPGDGAPPDGQPSDGEPSDGEMGPRQLATLLRTPVADLYRARELGLLPDPGPGGQWPPGSVAEIVRGWPQTTAAVAAARELGAARSAELLARLTGLPVTADHVAQLAARGLLTSLRSYQKRPLYWVADLEALAADPATLDVLTQLATPAGRLTADDHHPHPSRHGVPRSRPRCCAPARPAIPLSVPAQP